MQNESASIGLWKNNQFRTRESASASGSQLTKPDCVVITWLRFNRPTHKKIGMTDSPIASS